MRSCIKINTPQQKGENAQKLQEVSRLLFYIGRMVKCLFLTYCGITIKWRKRLRMYNGAHKSLVSIGSQDLMLGILNGPGKGKKNIFFFFLKVNIVAILFLILKKE